MTWTCDASKDCAARAKQWLGFARSTRRPEYRVYAVRKARELWNTALLFQRYVDGRLSCE